MVDLANVSFEETFQYDCRVFPVPRPGFLQRWLTMPESAALGLVKDGALRGYGVVRRCRNGYKIGPLLADDEAVAEALFVSLTSRLEPGTPVFLDTPGVNAAAPRLAERHRMKPIFETARMYTKEPPDLALDKVFGVTSFELG